MEVKRFFYDFGGFNTELFLYINQITNYGYIPYILKGLSSLFFYQLFIPYFIIACIVCLYEVQTSPAGTKEQKFFTYTNDLVKAGLCYSLFTMIYATLKYTVNLPRPYCSLSPTSYYSLITFEGERCLSSFPSAHSALALIIAYYLWPYLNKTLKIAFAITIIFVGLSRISLAMHYPADIIYGIIIGFGTIAFTEYLYRISKKKIFYPIIHFTFRYLKSCLSKNI
jgi:membrane-associated phospholipid phosphatase